ncbi:MAG TPA: hypothetical protein VFW92_10205 [Candidatus Limnocylindrales bacterium]|nr:hypothetical protein [Candidatus Limnocylindrales bacterium]
MTDKERLIARLQERRDRHQRAADTARATEPIRAAIEQAWAECAQECLYDVQKLVAEDEPDMSCVCGHGDLPFHDPYCPAAEDDDPLMVAAREGDR